jgi:hypothetical protein
MAPLGTTEHLADCKIRAIREAVTLCEVHMDIGLTVIERILEQDADIVNQILIDQQGGRYDFV